jgi:uncharacterized protein (DUF58 family)
MPDSPPGNPDVSRVFASPFGTLQPRLSSEGDDRGGQWGTLCVYAETEEEANIASMAPTNYKARNGARRADLLHPTELSRLGGMEFVARKVVEGFLLGLHTSPHRGFSAEFAELRAYQPGDDIRYVDWRMFGRSDRYYVKQFQEETNLVAHLLLDVSESMAWQSDPQLPSKLWYAKQVGAAVSLLLVQQGDSVGFAAFQDSVVRRLQAKGGKRQWYELLRQMEDVEAAGGTKAHLALRDIGRRLTKRGLIVLISDLLVDPEETRLALRFLRHRGHEVLVFHLLDPGERELPPAGDAWFFDPETKEELRVNAADLRSDYRAAVQSALREWERALRPHGMDYVTLDTDQPISRALGAYLRKRARLG